MSAAPSWTILGLAAAIRWQLREFERSSGVHTAFTCETHMLALERADTTALYRILQEALTDVARHAHAAQVAVTLRSEEARTLLEVRDDGCGIPDANIRGPESLGLLAMRERARLLGGTVDIDSVPGCGTTVRVCIPRPAPVAAATAATA